MFPGEITLCNTPQACRSERDRLSDNAIETRVRRDESSIKDDSPLPAPALRDQLFAPMGSNFWSDTGAALPAMPPGKRNRKENM